MKKILMIMACTILPFSAFASSSDPLDIVLMFTLYPLLLIGIFLICRGIVNWYYKINQRVKNQERIIELLESIEKKLNKTE